MLGLNSSCWGLVKVEDRFVGLDTVEGQPMSQD